MTANKNRTKQHKFPSLYVTTNIGKTRFWDIWVTREGKEAYIHTKSGEIGGKIQQPPPHIIEKGVGRLNAFQRAVGLAETRWKNKMRKGFAPKNNNTGTKINERPVIVPMRAYQLEDHRVIYPALIQPKIDGFRGLAFKNKKTGVEILSNTGRPYPHVDHITRQLQDVRQLDSDRVYLDGELYLPGYPINALRSILGSVSLNKAKEEISKKIRYYVFDMFDLDRMYLPYEERYNILKEIFRKKFKNVDLVPTNVIHNKTDIDKYFEKYVGEGFEGVIVRNLKGIYKLRAKSLDVLKSKDIKKDKFIIAGYKEGRGNNKGTIVFNIQCKKNPAKSFWTKPMGTREERRRMYEGREKFIGKEIMVKYFDIDDEGCVTKNPVGLPAAPLRGGSLTA